jgi:hypothetical protein
MNNLEKHYEQSKDKFDREFWEFYGELDFLPGYKIGIDGSVWSNKTNKNWKKLNIQVDHDGYPYIRLLNDKNKQQKCKIHRLLALCFIPNIDDKQFVLHKDDDKNNLSLDNLYWGTEEENYNDAIRNGKTPFGITKFKYYDIMDKIIRKHNNGSIDNVYKMKWTEELYNDIIKECT